MDDDNMLQFDSILDKYLNQFVNLCLVNIDNEKVILLKAPLSVKKYFGSDIISYYAMCDMAISKHADLEFEKEVKEKINLSRINAYLSENNVYRFSFKIQNQANYCEIVYMKLDIPDYLLMGFQILDTNKPSEKEQVQYKREELKRERSFLDVLTRKYASVYYVDLKNHVVEILKMDDRTNNVLHITDDVREKLDYEKIVSDYCERFVLKAYQDDFMQSLNRHNVMNELCEAIRFIKQFQTIPNSLGQCHLQLQIFRVNADSFDGTAIYAFQFIDDILSKEQKYQAQLEIALKNEIENNEILMSLRKIYTDIYIIDLEKNLYKRVSSQMDEGTISNWDLIAYIKNNVSLDYIHLLYAFFDNTTLQTRLAKEETIAMEYLDKKGNWHTGRYIVKKRNEHGVATQVLYVTNIISEQKRKEQRLISLVEDANKANQAKTDFLRQISHDIRTPINGIYGLLEIADRNAEDVYKLQECRDRIRTSLSYLMAIVDNVLDIKKAESNEIVLENKTFDLVKLLQEIVSVVELQANDNHLEFINHVDLNNIENPYLVGSPSLLKRVLMNIATNAIKYNRQKGSILLDCQEIGKSDTNVTYQFICKDTGIGMSEEFQKKAFNPYVQEGKDAITSYKGTGLGLSIVKQIVDKMDGKIELNSKENVGTTFVVTLPFQIDEQEEKIVKKEVFDLDLHGKKALLVEDNALNREIASMMLKDIGFEVLYASNGKEAVEILQNHKPYLFDCIFMDIMMPVMDGWQATKQIRNSNRQDLQTIPILAMSANAFKEDVQKSLDVGMNAHIVKPLTIENIQSALSKLKM